MTLEPTPSSIIALVSQLTVSKLADRVGTSADTLRYYERIGLLPEPERSPAGYRLYGDEAEERVRFIKRAQRFGLRLEEIGELLDIRRRGLCPCGRTRRLLEARVAELDRELATLSALREDIAEMIVTLPTKASDDSSCASDLIQIQPKPESSNQRRNHHEYR